jgi:hypothetical protein
MTPGWVLDMVMIRFKYEARLAGARFENRALGG